jgi:hypothetical protein
MSIPPDAEQLLQDTIFPELERGRADYDMPHTIGVVQKVRDLIHHNPDLQLDEAVLVIVAYAHDWGYAELFDQAHPNFEEVKKAKAEHMRISAEKIQHLLQNQAFSFLSNEQKERIVYLVSIHDKLDQVKETDGLAFMEADTLGALDIDCVIPTFDKVSNEQYVRGPLQYRLSKFITEYGKSEAQRLIKIRDEYYARM